MKVGGEDIAIASRRTGRNSASRDWSIVRTLLAKLRSDPQFSQLAATFFTTFAIFGVFLVQGIIVARILGPTGRGEFGTSLFFPRDVLLYAGLLGSIEIITGYAARGRSNLAAMRYSAAKLGLVTGVLTAVLGAVLSVGLLIPTNKEYLIPFCLVCCLFVPWEHMHLSISSVDRGSGNYRRYNLSRFAVAISFPLLVLGAWFVQLDQLTGISWLWLMCALYVLAKLVGLYPTVAGMHFLSRSKREEQIKAQQAADQQEIPTTGELLREGRPYALSTLVTELFERLDILLVLALADVTRSGYYFVAVPAAALLIIAPNALGVFTFNAGAQTHVRITRSMVTKVLGATVAIQLLATVVMAIIIERLIVVFYGAEFTNAVPFALWLLPASAIKGILQAADGYLKGRQKPMVGVWSRVVSIVVMLAFVGITYPSLGLISVPMAACVGQLISFLIIIPAIYLDVHQNASNDFTAGRKS